MIVGARLVCFLFPVPGLRVLETAEILRPGTGKCSLHMLNKIGKLRTGKTLQNLSFDLCCETQKVVSKSATNRMEARFHPALYGSVTQAGSGVMRDVFIAS